MKLFNRALIFILVLIFITAVNLCEIPTDGTSFMQVKTQTSVFSTQETESVFTYDSEVMDVLATTNFSRFSIKTTDCETVLAEFLARAVYEEQVNGDTVAYYYSPILETYVVINGEKVNLQVSINGETATVGYPMIDIGF